MVDETWNLKPRIDKWTDIAIEVNENYLLKYLNE